MHDTLIKDVKLHIDSIEGQNEEINISGGCAANSIKIEGVRLSKGKESFSSVFGRERKDVGEFYKNKNFLNSGFNISIPKKFEDSEGIELQIFNKKKWKTVLELNRKELTLSKTDFKISSKLTPDFVVIDDFYENPDEVRDFALSCKFAPHLQYHKGQRTEEKFIPNGIKEKFESLLHTKITSWEDQGANGVFQFCTAEDQLVYHIDNQSYAAVIYLTPNAPPSCGTTFFKSRRTGLRASPSQQDCERLNKNEQDLSYEIFQNNFYDKTDLEIVDVVGNVYNRLVIWNAKLIHAASEYFGDKKENSRLFHMFFFDVK